MSDASPPIIDMIVVRRNLRIGEHGRPEAFLEVLSTALDMDVVLSMLEQAKWSVGHRDWTHVPSLNIEEVEGE